jgi:prepilin-type N-terminal cleavage/methylation domain-containing protein
MLNKQQIRQTGFTLIEGLLVVAIFGLIMASLSGFILTGYRAYSYNFEQTTAIREARRGIEIMVKEIREAKIGDDGSYPLIQAGDLSFTFYSDIDRDASAERVRYFLDGTTFKKGIVQPSGDPPQYDLPTETVTILSQYVRNTAPTPIFTYFNGDWPADTINNPLTTLTRLSETKLMHLRLKINVDINRPPSDFVLESDAQVRNLKTNL